MVLWLQVNGLKATACVAYMDVGEEREQDAVSFAYMDVDEEREQDAVSFAYTTADILLGTSKKALFPR